MNIAALNVKIGADLADFNRGLDAVGDKLNKVAGSFKANIDFGKVKAPDVSSVSSAINQVEAKFEQATQEVKAEAQAMASAVNKSFQNVADSAKTSVARANNSLKNLADNFDKTKDKFSGFTRIGEGMQSIGTALSVGVTLPIVALGAASIKTFGDLQALKKGLTAVMGSAEAAEEEFKKLIVVAKLPGLGLQEAARGSVSLQAAGFSADQARESLLAFGNALATVGKGKNELNFVILALTQMQNKTSGFGQDLRQLTEQLPQLRGALTDAFGTADSEQIAKLGYTGAQVVEMITKEFAKLPSVTGGINNAFENLSDTITNSLASIGDDLNRAFNVEGAINKIGDVIERVTNAFISLPDPIKTTTYVIAGLAAAIGPLLLVIGSLLVAIPSVVAGFAVFKASIAPVIASFVAAALPIIAIVSLIAALSAAIYGIVKAADLFAIAFKRAFLEVKGYVNDAILSMFESIQGFGEKFDIDLGFDKAIQQAKNYQNQINQTLAITPNVTFKDAEDKMRQSVLDLFTGVKEELKTAISGTTETVKGGIEKINNELSKIGGGILDNVNNQLGIATEKSIAFGNSFDLVREKLTILETGISSLIEAGFSATSGFVQRLQKAIDNLIGRESVVVPVEFKAANTDLNSMFSQDFKFEGIQIEGTGLEALMEVNTQLDIATQKSLAFGSSFDVIGEKTNILRNAINGLLENGFNASSGAVVALQNQLAALNGSLDGMGAKAVEIGSIFRQALNGALQSFGEALGNLIAGNSIGSTFDKLLGLVADFVGDFGKMLISAGVAKLAFDNLFSNPYAAIAAGVALVAISSAIKGHLQGGMDAGGGSYGSGGGGGSTGSRSSQGYNPAFNEYGSSQDKELTATIQGTDLLFVVKEAERKEARVGG